MEETKMKNTMFKVRNYNGDTYYAIVPKVMTRDFTGIMEEYKNEVLGVYEVGKMPLTELPAEIQAEVMDTLKAFPSVTVTYEYGKFTTSACVGIKARYHFDHFVCGKYNDTDVYTEEERKQNYKECFG
jgi:hypothetical protein